MSNQPRRREDLWAVDMEEWEPARRQKTSKVP